MVLVRAWVREGEAKEPSASHGERWGEGEEAKERERESERDELCVSIGCRLTLMGPQQRLQKQQRADATANARLAKRRLNASAKIYVTPW